MRKHLFPVLLLANTLWSCLFAQTPIVMDMVHHNPGEPFTNTWFNEPGKFSYISKFHIIISCKLIVYIVMCFYQETN